MDLDSQLRGLHAFRQRMERLFDGGALARLEAAIASLDGADTTSGEELAKRVEEIGEHVAALQVAVDELPKLTTAALDAALKPLQEQLTAVAKLADPAVLDLLDWLARNREAIDVLTSLGDTVDGTTEETAGADGATKEAPPTETAQAGS